MSRVRIDYRRNDFDEKDLEKVMMSEQIMAELIESYIKYGENKKAIVFAINKSHSKDIVKRFNNEGISAKYIDSDTKKEERELIVKEFKEGKYKVLCNVNIFTEGFDCPDVEVVQLARPTKSLSLYLQQIGRCMRPYDGKEYGLILDNACLWETHGLLSSDFEWSLKKEVRVKKGKNKVKKKGKKPEFEFVANEVLGLELEEVDSLTAIKKEFEKNENLYYFDKIYGFLLLININSGFSGIDDLDIGDYILNDGELVYDDYEINDSLQIIEINNKFGIFDKYENNIVLNVEYDYISKADVFSRCIVEKNGVKGIFECETRILLLQVEFDSIEKLYSCEKKDDQFLCDNLTFLVSKDGLFGVIKFHDFILECIYDQILIDLNRHPKIINARIGDQWLLYDNEGNIFSLNEYKCSNFNDNGRKFIQFENLYGLLNENENILDFPLIIQDLTFFGNLVLLKFFDNWSIWGLDFKNSINDIYYKEIIIMNKSLIVKKDNKYFVMNQEGEIQSDLKYDLIEHLEEDMFLVKSDKVWKIISNNKTLFEGKRKTVLNHYQNIKTLKKKEEVISKNKSE